MKKIVLYLGALIIMLSVFVGCSNSADTADVCSQAINALLSDEKVDNVDFVTSRGSIIDNPAYAGSTASVIVDKIEYSVINIKTSDENNIAEIQFTYPDMVEIVNQYVSTQDDDDLYSWLSSKLDGDYPQKQETIEVELNKHDDKYYLVIDNKLSNILTGGLLDYKLNAESNAYSGIKGE